MVSKWKVTSNLIGDKKMYAVYQLLDENAVDHSGNRELATNYMDNQAIAQKIADKLNEGVAK